MSFISGTLAAVMGADQARGARNANMQMARETNDLNYRMFQESRGAGGSSLLPLYAPAGTEEALMRDALAAYGASMGGMSPEEQYNYFKGISEGYRPQIEAGDRLIQSIFDGGIEQQQLQNNAPVSQARTQLAQSQVDAIGQSLRYMLGQQNAAEAARGYSGAGSFAQGRNLDAVLRARQQAAGGLAAANLENQMNVEAIKKAALALQLGSLDMPLNRAAASINLAQAPTAAVGQNMALATQPLNFFRMSPQAFRADQMPQQQPIASAAQLALQGMSQAGSAALGSYLKSNPSWGSWGTAGGMSAGAAWDGGASGGITDAGGS